MKLSYPAWRRRSDNGAIAVCDDCRFWRRYIVLCHHHTQEDTP